jgi:hypothetical protein
MPWSSKWSFSLGLSHQNPVHVSALSHAAYCMSLVKINRSHLHLDLSFISFDVHMDPCNIHKYPRLVVVQVRCNT